MGRHKAGGEASWQCMHSPGQRAAGVDVAYIQNALWGHRWHVVRSSPPRPASAGLRLGGASAAPAAREAAPHLGLISSYVSGALEPFMKSLWSTHGRQARVKAGCWMCPKLQPKMLGMPAARWRRPCDRTHVLATPTQLARAPMVRLQRSAAAAAAAEPWQDRPGVRVCRQLPGAHCLPAHTLSVNGDGADAAAAAAVAGHGVADRLDHKLRGCSAARGWVASGRDWSCQAGPAGWVCLESTMPQCETQVGGWVGVGCRVQGAGCRVRGAGWEVRGAGCRVQGAGCRVQGAACRVGGHLLGLLLRHAQAEVLVTEACDVCRPGAADAVRHLQKGAAQGDGVDAGARG